MPHLVQMIRQAFQTARRKLARRWLRWRMRLRGRPESEALAAERRLRGREQLRMLERADVAVVSFGKSGRTWVRVMLSHVFREMYDLPARALLGFDNFHNMDPRVPRIFFTHDNYIKDCTGETRSKRAFYGKPVILVARDPRDVAVSQFFQWKFRLRADKVAINGYPERGADLDMLEFVLGDHGASMSAVCDYLNLWAREADRLERFHLVRYEDLRREPRRLLGGMLEFMGARATAEAIARAVELGSVENMRAHERSGRFRLAGARMAPGDRRNPDSYKVRRAKVGGYRDYFGEAQVAEIDARLERRLHTLYGYGQAPAPVQRSAAKS